MTNVITTTFEGITVAALTALMAVGSAVGLIGCTPPDPVDAAIVIQNTAGTPVWDTAVLDDCITQVRDSNGKITVTVADSNPTASTFDFSKTAGSKLNQDRTERQLREYLQQAADDPGTDVLKAVEVGASSVAGSSNVLGVYVLASGICDEGLLDMATTNLIESDPEQVGEYYAARNELADLSGVSQITWYGMGSTAGEQAAPSNAQRTVIVGLYQETLQRSGTTLSVQSTNIATAELRPENIPPVKVVDFSPVDKYAAPQQPEAGETVTREFSSTELGFVGDGTDFVDPAQAKTALTAIAEQLVGDPTLSATVTCTAASYPWKDGYAQELSEQRAQRVVEELCSMGVSESQLTAIGAGSGKPDDIDPETGLQDPVKSAAKRKTIIEVSSK